MVVHLVTKRPAQTRSSGDIRIMLDNDLDLIIDLHLHNERQSPGSIDETRRGIELARLNVDVPIRVVDIGCGTGASALVLARTLNAHVTAIDAAEPFVDQLRIRAAQAGLSDRIRPTVGRMEALEIPDDEFDLIWSEGAIYNMGFAAGLRAWRRHLRPNGAIVISELTWTTSVRPIGIEAHWTREYPGIRMASDNLRCIEDEGYQPLGVFFIPRKCWEANYYAPLRTAFPAFLARHDRSEAAQRIVAAEEAEMALYREFGEWYGYAFYIARKTAEI